jgi:hypothetical protein
MIFKYFWIVFIITSLFNWFNSIRKIKNNNDIPEVLKTGYYKFYHGFSLSMFLPWVIVGIGQLCGLTNNVFDYFRPRTLNPIVLVFHLYIIVSYIITIYFIFFKNGADFFVKHPGIIVFQGFGGTKNLTSKSSIKLFFALCLLGGIAAIVMMWTLDFPTFKI